MKPKGGSLPGSQRTPPLITGRMVALYLYPKQIDFLASQPNGSELVRNLIDQEQARQDELKRIKQNNYKIGGY